MNTTLLLILDGYGETKEELGNAIKIANTKNIDYLKNKYLYLEGKASGLDVGLPEGQMGNSEVGHLNIGAGRVVYQDLTKITKSIKDGVFFKEEKLLNAMNRCKANNSALHLVGLLSDGGVHSHNDHLYGLLKMAKDNKVEKVYIHAILDGRDTPPSSGKQFIIDLENKIEEIGVGEIVTISGRYYAMDRDTRWDRVEVAYNTIVLGDGEKHKTPEQCISANYSENLFDEFVKPTSILNDRENAIEMKDNDEVVIFNFRPDRAREIITALCNKEFDSFNRKKGFIKLNVLTFTDYDKTITNKEVLFEKEELVNTLGECVDNAGMKQIRIAETEKYAHVTFFFNGGKEEPNNREDRILIDSPKVATYDLQPEMSVDIVSDEIVRALKKDKYSLIIANFANPDMVGHTGNLEATVKAVEATDLAVKKVYDAIIETNSNMFICADHGNADKVIDYNTKKSFTAHTTNPVPFIIVNYECKGIKKEGQLSDVAPTILEMLGLDKPEEMTGESLLIK